MLALIVGLVFAGAAARGVGVVRRQPGCRISLAYLAMFLVVALAAPDWFLDLSFIALVAGLTLPLLVLEVLRLGRGGPGPRTGADPGGQPAAPAGGDQRQGR